MKRTGIIGHPVGHSLSPVFQNAAFRECGLDVGYELWDTETEALHGRVVSLASPEILGANVTIPHKEAVIPFLDDVGGQVVRVGAVNTIVNRAGRLFGFNTDGPGFVSALKNEALFDPAGKQVLLLGAGGSARGIAFALGEARAASVSVANRSLDRAKRLVGDVNGAGYTARVHTAETSFALYDCVVNCTSVGMAGGPDPGGLPADPSRLRAGALVVDIVYAPEETPFLRAAVGAGLPVLGGLPMLIYQGALAFEHWTGVPAPVDVMFEAARKALAERARQRELTAGREAQR